MGAGRCLHEIFEQRAREAPERVAVTAADGHLTYAELDARSTRLAARLARVGAGPDVLVGLHVDRGAEMLVGLLGILKAGGAYVPIDATWPDARVRFLLADSGVPAVVTSRRLAPRLEGCDARPVLLDAPDGGEAGPPPDSGVDEGNLAYMIYTSGSTGTPKGVLVEHRNVTRLFEATSDWFGFGPDDVWTLFHSVSFDFSVWEIWGALLHGGRLVVVPARVAQTPADFHALLREEGVTVLNQTPSAFRGLVAADLARDEPAGWPLRHVIFGGERLDVQLLRPWIERYGDERPALVNMYGITETTVHVTYRPVTRADLERADRSPIGVPIPDLYVHLLDDAGRPVPDGTPGELHVGGAGVARGYHDRPELTAERFVTVAGRRLYRSGDRAVRAGGELYYLGRADDQLKVRGFRIEPGEVEAALSQHPRVSSVIVRPHDYGQGDVRLVAFVVPRAGVEPTPALGAELEEALSRRAAEELPAHMRPSSYVLLADVPLTPQGKVDRAALQALVAQAGRPPGDAGGGQAVDGPGAEGAAAGETEREVARIVAAILQRDVPREADLFDLGATSLAFVRIVAQVNERFGLSLTGAELGEEATVARLSACVEQLRERQEAATAPA